MPSPTNNTTTTNTAAEVLAATTTVDNELNQDSESQDKTSSCNTNTYLAIQPQTASSSGYYDAEKCRAFIANQIKVNKIDRFAAQLSRVTDIEFSNETAIGNLANMFDKYSSRVVHDFTLKCKMGVQSHRQDRILNDKRKRGPYKTKKANKEMKGRNMIRKSNKKQEQFRYYPPSISNDLLYGHGAQLVHTLLSSQSKSIINNTCNNNHIKRKRASELDSFESREVGCEANCSDNEHDDMKEKTDLVDGSKNNLAVLSECDYLLSDSFEPELYVKKLEELLKINLRKSRAINSQLSKIGQTFERLALEHRDKVDRVHAACQVKDNGAVIRRSAYNLSIAAIKATSTPVHVNMGSSSNEL